MPHIIVGTAGHIDHGKTALVKALTGIAADRLKEEKERGITIDIGFANLVLDSNTTIGFIDVPGHERFIKNMLAGVGGIDLVMLVIAADESVMPQTREHLDICSLLHIQHGFTVLTKIDNVDREMVDLVEEDVRDFLKGGFLENSPILRESSLTHEGVPEVIATLRQCAERIQPKDATQIFRLPIDRCFTMKGFGTIATGTLIAGRVDKDDEVEILPAGRLTRVRGIQVHGHRAAEASAGQRTALNLQGMEVSDIQRGMVLTAPRTFKPTSMLDCHLELLPSAPRPIVMRKRIRLHIGTAELMGYAVLLGQDRLEPGQSSFAQIRIQEPTFALPGDRFIIRQFSPMVTIGGGQVLDAYPKKHRRSEKGLVDKLRILKDGSVDDRLMLLIDEAALQSIDLPHLVGRLGLTPALVRERLDVLAKATRVLTLSNNPPTVVAAVAFQQAVTHAVAEVKQFHHANPLVLGLGREELKNRVMSNASGAVFQAALDRLVAERKLTLAQEIVHEYGRTVTLKAGEEEMRNQLTARFLALGLQIPPPEELIDGLKLDQDTARKIIQLLLKEKVLVKITDADVRSPGGDEQTD